VHDGGVEIILFNSMLKEYFVVLLAALNHDLYHGLHGVLRLVGRSHHFLHLLHLLLFALHEDFLRILPANCRGLIVLELLLHHGLLEGRVLRVGLVHLHKLGFGETNIFHRLLHDILKTAFLLLDDILDDLLVAIHITILQSLASFSHHLHLSSSISSFHVLIDDEEELLVVVEGEETVLVAFGLSEGLNLIDESILGRRALLVGQNVVGERAPHKSNPANGCVDQIFF
jgi:hypothetical protein